MDSRGIELRGAVLLANLPLPLVLRVEPNGAWIVQSNAERLSGVSGRS